MYYVVFVSADADDVRRSTKSRLKRLVHDHSDSDSGYVTTYIQLQLQGA